MADPPTTLTFESGSTRREGIEYSGATECCNNIFHLLPNLVLQVRSRGKRHSAVTTVSFADKEGRQTTFEGWTKCWGTIVHTVEMERPAFGVDPSSIGLHIEARTYGKSAFADYKLFLRNGQSDLFWFKHWRFETVEGDLPTMIDVSTGKKAKREGATYYCYTLF